MFADVQGFTALAEQLDFETVSDLLKEIWFKLDQVIEAHGGYIDKHMGDGVLAIWGAPSAGDNDAENAVTAGLALNVAMDEFARESRLPGAGELKMRVGIHSGQAFAGYIGMHNEYTIIGDTVNVASRLEQYTEAGSVIISESTFLLTRGKFIVFRPEPVQLKGKHEPVMTYLIEGSQAISGRGNYRGSESMETHMVGRNMEMEQLAGLFSQSRGNPLPTMAIVTGQPGIGKSRLSMEFSTSLENLDHSIFIMTARALGQARQVPFYLWKMLWHNRLNLRDDDPPRNSNEKFLSEIQKLWGKSLGIGSAIETAHVIGHLIGMDWSDSPYLAAIKTPQARVERAFALTREILRRIAAVHTLVILIDDLQWVDKNSLELLESLFTPGEPSLPVFILAGSRPEFLQQQPRWSELAEVINLAPLPANAELVATAYPILSKYPKSILQTLARQAEGNPYFLEEMVKSLIKTCDDGTIPLAEAAIHRLRAQPPESLQAALQARLDTLPREIRSIALLAALVGRVFWVGAVIAAIRMATKFGTSAPTRFSYANTERIVREALIQLEQAELVFPKAGYNFSQEQEYIFKSSLLRDVAYNLILMRYRPFYHKAVADWLANRTDADFNFMAAEHYELANWPVQAARQYELAAEHAKLRGATDESERLLSLAVALREKAKSQKTFPIGSQ